MKRVISAVEAGRCVVASGANVLKNSEVMLDITRRAALPVLALSGPTQAPVLAVTASAVLRATAQPGGVVVLVEPETADLAGVEQLAYALKEGQHAPQVLVVARQYNPFTFGSALSGLAVAHIKGRGQQFFRELPVPPAVETLPELESPKASQAKTAASSGPRIQMLGREDEVAQLAQWLATPGPVVVSGPMGVGKRWVVEAGIAEAGLTRLPDIALGHGCAADTLLARLAAIGKKHGAEQLDVVLRREHTITEVIAALVESLKAAEGAASEAFIIHDLQYAAGREGDFFRKSVLESVVEALLVNVFPLRVVFTSRVQPVFYAEGVAANVRRMELAGIKGRFFFEIFQAFDAPEFAREKFGPMADKVHGHPFVARTYALAVAERGVELADDAKFLKMESLGDLERLERTLAKRIEKLDGPIRGALSKLAHLRDPVDGGLLAELGITRKGRIELLRRGLLEAVHTAAGRLYYVHALTRAALGFREVHDFDCYAEVSTLQARLARDAGPVERVAYTYEANRTAAEGRRFKNRLRTDYPDTDPDVNAIYSLMRGQKPNFALAEQRVAELVKRHPANADLWLAKAELLRRQNAKVEVLAACYEEAFEKAAVPEIFHDAVGFYLARRQRKNAIIALEKGVAMLPDQPRLKTRLAALVMKEGRRKEGIELLRAAMDQAPMLPDAYGLLGMAKRDEGAAALDDAETLLREAVRLAPGDAVQVSRLADLLAHKSRLIGGSEGPVFMAEARELLDAALKGNDRAPEAHLLLAQLVRQEGKDFDRAVWLLKKVKKDSERNPERKLRVALEFARIDVARGDLDAAESTVRGLAERDPTNHEVFALLSSILEARQLYIPAHAEMHNAHERAPRESLEARHYAEEQARLQALIEAGAGNFASPVASSTDDEVIAAPLPTQSRVIRRKKGEDETEPVEAEPAVEPEAPADDVTL